MCIELLRLKDDSAYYALTGSEVKMPKMGDSMFVSSYETSARRQGKTFGDSIAYFEKRDDAEALQDVRKQAGSNQDRTENSSFHADSRQAYNYLVIKHVEWYEELAQRSFPANSEQLLRDIAAVLQHKSKSESIESSALSKNMKEIPEKSKRGSLERRGINAMIQHVLPDAGLIASSGTVKQAKIDAGTILEGNALQKIKQTRQKLSVDIIEDAVT